MAPLMGVIRAVRASYISRTRTHPRNAGFGEGSREGEISKVRKMPETRRGFGCRGRAHRGERLDERLRWGTKIESKGAAIVPAIWRASRDLSS